MVPPSPSDRRGRPAGARAIAGTVGLLLMLAVLPAAPMLAAPGSGADAAAAIGVLKPSIQYEQAMAHAGDTTAFAPGARVSVPFTPRAADRWTIDGARSVPLPAGRLTGGAIRGAQPATDRPAAPDSMAPAARPAGPIDTPFVDPSAGIFRPPGRRRRPGRAAAGGLRFPAVLGDRRRVDPARLGEALDDRLLRRGRGRQRRPPADEPGRLHDGRLERLDELEPDRCHRPGTCQRGSRRVDRPELRLDVEPAWDPEGAARQRGRPR